MQQLSKEWFGFVIKRLHEDIELFHAIHAPVVAGFAGLYPVLQDAFAQYGEQMKRMMHIAQGAAWKRSPPWPRSASDPPAPVTMTTDKAA